MAVVEDPDVDLVVEVIGGIEPARELITAALAAGQAGRHGEQGAARQRRRRAVRRSPTTPASTCCSRRRSPAASRSSARCARACAASRSRRVMGIVNGTTNYILTKMTEEGADVRRRARRGAATRLRRARPDGRRRGLRRRRQGGDHRLDRVRRRRSSPATSTTRASAASPPPTSPSPGASATSSSCSPSPSSTRRRRRRSRCACTRRWCPSHHPLASVRESFNAVFVEGDAVGSLMFYGRGAGGLPTASAVLGDVIDAAVNLSSGTHASLGTFARPDDPADRRDHGRVPARASTSPTSPACCTPSRACSPSTA